MRIAANAPATIVLPASGRLTTGELSKKVQGPYEIILQDPNLKCKYKRLVLLFPLFGNITFQFPKPKIVLTAAAVIEIVAEIDARLLTPQELESVKATPLRFIKVTVIARHIDLADALAFYGLRIRKHPTASTNFNT